MDVLVEVRNAIRRHDLIPRGETVVAGVSGGPDSLCLLHALMALRDEFGFSLRVAHLNHQLRGAEAEADADFVADLAAGWHVHCTIGSRDVASLARNGRLSIEEAARHARYAFLTEIAQTSGSRTVAVAHNADDQVESVLMHFLRGSGTLGLRGMLPKTDLSEFRLHPASLAPSGDAGDVSVLHPCHLIRPLLCVPRADIERYCRAHDLRPRFDRSNLDTTFFRNRLRRELLPQLEMYNPNIREVLRRTAGVVAAEAELLRGATERAWRAAVVSESDTAIRFNLSEWRGLPIALQRATLREAIRRLRPALRNVNFVHIENAVEQLAHAQTGVRVTLPQRLMLSVDYTTFTIAPGTYTPETDDWPLLAAPETTLIRLPGHTLLPGARWQLEAAYLDDWPVELFAKHNRWLAYLDAGSAGHDLSLRARRSGDMFHPQGMPASTRLHDWMTNAKIPRHVRDRLPLVLVGEQIAWVSGYRIGQPFVVSPGTRRVLRLSFRRLADPPAR